MANSNRSLCNSLIFKMYSTS